MLTIFGAVVELEREYILQRQHEGIDIAKSQGKYTGRKPIDHPDFDSVVPHCNDIPTEATRRSQAMSIASNPLSIKNNQIQEFVNLVGRKGYSFCPSTFTNRLSRKDTFKQTQLFALYFDSLSHFNKDRNNNFSFHDMKRRAKQYHLPIFFAYDVFSGDSLQDNHHMFCIVFLNDVPIISLRTAETIQKALLTIFPEADKEHGSVIDLYFGGNEVLYYNQTMPTINADIAILSVYRFLREQYGNNYKRKMISFAEDTGILLDDKNRPVVTFAEELRDNSDFDVDSNENPDRIFIEENDKNSPKPTIYRKDGSGENLSRLNFTIHFQDDPHLEGVDPSTTVNRSKVHQLYRSDTLKALSFNCELYQELESLSSERELSYQELLGLASNLTHIESGRKTFVRILKSRSSDETTISDWEHCFHYLNRRKPYPCSSFCPYHTTCIHGQNILSTCSIRPHQIEKVSNNEDQLVSLDDAYDDFLNNFKKSVDSNERVWHVIKSQTALGKTQAVLQLLKDHPEMNVLIVVPTNKLKREVEERAKGMGISLLVSPSLHEIEDELSWDVWDDIEKRLSLGKSPIPSIKKVIKSGEKYDKELLKEYLSERNKFYSSTGCAVTTHRRLASIDLCKYDLVIIDEDYIFSTILADRTEVSLKNLKKLKKKLYARDSLYAKIKKILKKSENQEFFFVDEIDYNDSYDDIDTKINIRALCEGTHFYFREDSDHDCGDFVFTKRPDLPDGVKFIMLSATANESICNFCFGEENVRFYDCKEAVLTGTLNQYYDRPMSRAYLDRHPEVMEQIKEWTGFEHTITFKKYADYCTDNMYYGNCVGCDVLKGENIDVIGTPHQPDWVYKLFAFTFGFDIDDDLKPRATVTNNGYRFHFATFDNEILRMIQFYIIETDLEQAIGRARLLRCDATVNLFSNFPLRQAILKESEYNKKGQDS